MTNDKRFLDGTPYTKSIKEPEEFEKLWKKGFFLFLDGKVVGNDSDSLKDSCFEVKELPNFDEISEVKIKLNKSLEIFIRHEIDKLIFDNEEINSLKRQIRKVEQQITEEVRKKYTKLSTHK